jgi:hypothetical protein
MRVEKRVPQEWVDQYVTGLAGVLLPFADKADPQPVTAGPVGLPDLVQKLSWLARESLGFGARAMTGADAVSPQEWWRLGEVYAALGAACQEMAATVAAQQMGGRL